MSNEKVTSFYWIFSGGCSSLLDLGCCEGNHTKHFPIPEKMFVDIEHMSNTLEPFLKADIRYAGKLFRPNSYDLVTALDVIEHLHKEDGCKLPQDMEQIASKRILIFSPQGEYMVGECQEGQLQHHAHWSGWTEEELSYLGFTCLLCPDFHFSLGIGAFWAWKELDGSNITEQIWKLLCL